MVSLPQVNQQYWMIQKQEDIQFPICSLAFLTLFSLCLSVGWNWKAGSAYLLS